MQIVAAMETVMLSDVLVSLTEVTWAPVENRVRRYTLVTMCRRPESGHSRDAASLILSDRSAVQDGLLCMHILSIRLRSLSLKETPAPFTRTNRNIT